MKTTIPILNLKPTQFAIGMEEVKQKIKELNKCGKKKRNKFLKNHRVPVVISPRGFYYALDHHHAVWALWSTGVSEVQIEVIKDFSKSKYSFKKFWALMVRSKWAHLYDQFGNGPHSALYLPQDIRGMGDDPYRSLAWVVRNQGGFEKCEKTYSEFLWAQFFREKKLLHSEGRFGFERCIKRALRLARSNAAKKLPGFLR